MKIIKVTGTLGIKNARKLYNTARMVLEAGPDCVIDFSEARRIDCSAAQVILALRRECARRGGNCEFKNPNEATARLMKYTGLETAR